MHDACTSCEWQREGRCYNVLFAIVGSGKGGDIGELIMSTTLSKCAKHKGYKGILVQDDLVGHADRLRIMKHGNIGNA